MQGRARRLTLRLKPGRSVNRAVAEAFAEAGFAGGYIRLEDVPVSPMNYVIPAASPDAAHAAWYSATRSPAGVTTIEEAGAIVGWRDGEPFLHCHGIWREADGARRMGHLLPLDSEFAAEVEAEAWGVCGAIFDVRDDPETNFRLFSPVSAEHEGTSRSPSFSSPPRGAGTGRVLLATVRPNEDITIAIERLCRENGIGSAAVHGIGSLVGADFEDGSHLASYATELLVGNGEMSAGTCRLDISVVGMDGEIAEGRLARGSNPVCVTFELVIEET